MQPNLLCKWNDCIWRYHLITSWRAEGLLNSHVGEDWNKVATLIKVARCVGTVLWWKPGFSLGSNEKKTVTRRF
eukprot:scaffold244_cov172-Amphora_coffeaeformis.AAC.16